MTSSENILDYDKLVEAYNTNLDITLRGFRPAEEMLDTWVPDENAVRSLSSLVEAAQLCGSDSVQVRVSNETLKDQSLEELREKLATLGTTEVIRESGAVLFRIGNLQEIASFRSVRPIYQQKLMERAARLRFRRELHAGNGSQIALKATEDHSTLAWLVQTDQQVITDAVFECKTRGPLPAALDCLCGLLVGMPVLEAREHAIVRLEFALRDLRQRHPVNGILLPQNADPIFRLPARLVNRLYDDYVTSTGFRPGLNFFDPGPRPGWQGMSPADREARVSQTLADNRDVIGINDGDVGVVECAHAYAVTIRFADAVPISAKRGLALGVERLVRQHCDPRLEVFCEERKDLSKLRRLTEKAN
jgi:NifU-like protein involved in Fe-S cluster formation